MNIDELPRTCEERLEIANKIRDQSLEIGIEKTVTCFCGKSVKLLYAFKCFDCGIYFCRKCAPRHFGKVE